MADIRQEILEKYGFDIEKIDLIKEYKIPSPDISSKKLEELLSKRGLRPAGAADWGGVEGKAPAKKKSGKMD